MTRRQGFARGDFDTSFPLDDKFLELRGSEEDALHYYAAVGVYFTVIAAAWREADRKAASRTTPDAPEQVEALVRVGLLDAKQSVKVASFRRWVGRALDSRKSDSDRKARNRSGMSRGTPPDNGVTPPESAARARQGRDVSGRNDSDGLVDVEGGPGGDRRADLEAWLLVKFRAPTDAQRRFLDTYCQVFDATGPDRAARLILSHPDDPIAFLKDDLASFRADRAEEARKSEEPKPRPKPRRPGLSGVNQEMARMFHQKAEEDEQARLELLAGGKP